MDMKSVYSGLTVQPKKKYLCINFVNDHPQIIHVHWRPSSLQVQVKSFIHFLIGIRVKFCPLVVAIFQYSINTKNKFVQNHFIIINVQFVFK